MDRIKRHPERQNVTLDKNGGEGMDLWVHLLVTMTPDSDTDQFHASSTFSAGKESPGTY